MSPPALTQRSSRSREFVQDRGQQRGPVQPAGPASQQRRRVRPGQLRRRERDIDARRRRSARHRPPRRGCRRICAPSISTSFGHFSRAATPLTRPSARTIASPSTAPVQPRRSAGICRHAQQHREHQPGAGRAEPVPAGPTPAGQLLLGDQHRPCGQSAGRGQIGVGRSGDGRVGDRPSRGHRSAARRPGRVDRPPGRQHQVGSPAARRRITVGQATSSAAAARS